MACEKNQAQKEVKQNIADLCKTTLATVSGCSLLKGLTEGLMQKVSEEENKTVVHAEVKLKHPVFEKNPDFGEQQTFLKEPRLLNDFEVLVSSKDREPSMSINDIWSWVGECVHTVDINGSAYRLSVVDKDIWIPSYTEVVDYEVFNISTKTLTRKLHNMRAFCKTHTGHVIAACDNGLFILNKGGELQYKLSDGCFTDVCSTGKEILAVQYDTCNVQVYRLSGNKWSKEAMLPLKGGKDSNKALHAVNNVFYVSCFAVDTIYKYSLQGEFLEQNGGSEGNALGQFHRPYVSGTDSEQALIVCDVYNHRVQVRSRQGAWKQYTLEGVTGIRDVVILGDFLFVLHEKNNGTRNLSVYKIIPQQ